MGLFGNDDEDEADDAGAANLPKVPDWQQRDQLTKEKEVLGFYLSSHPLDEHKQTLATYCSHTSSDAAALGHRTDVMLGGMLSSIKLSHTKNPKPGNPSRYAMFDLEDTAGMMRCILWPEQFATYGHLVEADSIVVVRGAIDKRPGSEEANLIINEIIPLEELAGRYTRGVRIRVFEETHGEDGLGKLHEILRGYPGKCQLQLLLCLRDGTRVSCQCSGLQVAVNDEEMHHRIDGLLGPGNFRLLTAPPKAAAAAGRGNGRSRR